MVSPAEAAGRAHIAATSLIGIACASNKLATGYREVVLLLEDMRAKQGRILWCIEALKDIVGLNRLRPDFFTSTLQKIEVVKADLVEVQDAFNNRSKLSLILRSQSTLAALNQINNKLTDLENSLDIVGMIGELLEIKFGYMEERFDRQDVRMEELLMALICALGTRSDPRAVELLRRDLESLPSDDVQGASGNRNLSLNSFSSEESVSEFYLSSGKSMYKDNDFNQAARYLRGAYTNGKWEAAYYLGNLYYNGYGVTKSYEKAFQFYQISANYGDMASKYELGV